MFCTLDQVPKVALFFSSSMIQYFTGEPINRRTTYANHGFLELGCRLNHSSKTELPNFLEPVIYRKQINIRNAENAQAHIDVILFYPHAIKPTVHRLIVKFAKGISENSLPLDFYFVN